jgi:uncharacterized protein (UPF0548 family)
VFLLRRPPAEAIGRFLDRSRRLPLSYGEAGILAHPPAAARLDEQVFTVGRGAADFERARGALARWAHFELGWLEAFPRPASIDPGTEVAVLIRHLGFWSLNGARVVARIGGTGEDGTFGFAYGTLTSHAEHGEESFEVRLDPRGGDVTYRIRAVSWAHSPLARLGLPIVRVLQARFRRDSAAAMQRALAAGR